MHPTLFTIGNRAISSYTVLLDLGLILGLVLAYLEAKRLLHNGDLALDAGLWAIVGGIVGGRLGFVLANWEVFRETPLRALYVWEGGLAFHGAFVGGLLALTLVAWLQGRARAPHATWPYLLQMLDVLTPGIAVGLAFGWLGCLLYGSAYGVVGEGFGYAVLPDVTGLEAPRFATQVFGLIQSLAVLVLVLALRGRWPFRGAAFTLFGLLYFAGQFFLENYRGDETLYLFGWRLPQLLNLALALLLATGLLILWWQNRGSADLEAAAEEMELEAEPLETEVEPQAADDGVE